MPWTIWHSVWHDINIDKTQGCTSVQVLDQCDSNAKLLKKINNAYKQNLTGIHALSPLCGGLIVFNSILNKLFCQIIVNM